MPFPTRLYYGLLSVCFSVRPIRACNSVKENNFAVGSNLAEKFFVVRASGDDIIRSVGQRSRSRSHSKLRHKVEGNFRTKSKKLCGESSVF